MERRSIEILRLRRPPRATPANCGEGADESRARRSPAFVRRARGAARRRGRPRGGAAATRSYLNVQIENGRSFPPRSPRAPRAPRSPRAPPDGALPAHEDGRLHDHPAVVRLAEDLHDVRRGRGDVARAGGRSGVGRKLRRDAGRHSFWLLAALAARGGRRIGWPPPLLLPSGRASPGRAACGEMKESCCVMRPLPRVPTVNRASPKDPRARTPARRRAC